MPKTTLDQVKLGNKVKNTISEFEGTAIIKARHISGADQIVIEGVRSKKDNGVFGAGASETVDVQFVDVIADHLADRATERPFPEDVKLGAIGIDKMTKKEGIIDVLLEHIGGCHHVRLKLTSKNKDGELDPPIQIDLQQLEIKKPEPAKEPVMKEPEKRGNGGPGEVFRRVGDDITRF